MDKTARRQMCIPALRELIGPGPGTKPSQQDLDRRRSLAQQATWEDVFGFLVSMEDDLCKLLGIPSDTSDPTVDEDVRAGLPPVGATCSGAASEPDPALTATAKDRHLGGRPIVGDDEVSQLMTGAQKDLGEILSPGEAAAVVSTMDQAVLADPERTLPHAPGLPYPASVPAPPPWLSNNEAVGHPDGRPSPKNDNKPPVELPGGKLAMPLD